MFQSLRFSLALSKPVWKGYFIQHCHCVFQANYIFCWMVSFWVTDVWIVLDAPCHNGCYFFIWLLDCSSIYAAFYQTPAVKAYRLISHCLCYKRSLSLQECTFLSFALFQNLVCCLHRGHFKTYRCTRCEG